LKPTSRPAFTSGLGDQIALGDPAEDVTRIPFTLAVGEDDLERFDWRVAGSTTSPRPRIGGSRRHEAFKIILSDSKVKGILVNIFGGIAKCDLIARR